MRYEYVNAIDFVAPYMSESLTQYELAAFSQYLSSMLSQASMRDSEESQKQEFSAFLEKIFSYTLRSRGKIDLAILEEDEVVVLMECKTIGSREFPRIKDSKKSILESKAFFESILYFLREREEGNNYLKHIVLCTLEEIFVIDSKEYERIFGASKEVRKAFLNCDKKVGLDTSTQGFYDFLARFCKENKNSMEFTYVNFKEALEDSRTLAALYKLLCPTVLLKHIAYLDANTLNQAFYEELLHILGLEEVEEKGVILIKNSKVKGALCTCIMEQFDLEFSEAMGLLLMWNNRILFLRLLESLLLSFEHIADPFLSFELINEFKILDLLFFEVLAKKNHERLEELPSAFKAIPYLNSSLFERTILEKQGKEIKLLNQLTLNLHPRSILKKRHSPYKNKKNLPFLEYLFAFLHAYDFTTTSKDIVENIKQNHDTLINSAVLGLVFEKLNGYEEGSFYTPSFITNHMSDEAIKDLALKRFNEKLGLKCENLKSLRAHMDRNFSQEAIKEWQKIFLTLKICDPSVGSGHFLVAALNSLLQISNILGLLPSLLSARAKLELKSDEVLIYGPDRKLMHYSVVEFEDDPLHKIQKELFETKKDLIENCLFGVDINPNSCEITKLRLWIELLKSSHYIFEDSKNTLSLNTLPNIDINIKCGNSLICNFPLDSHFNLAMSADVSKNLKKSMLDYKQSVSLYKEALGSKSAIVDTIHKLKAQFVSYLIDALPHKSRLIENLRKLVEVYGNFVFNHFRDEFEREMVLLCNQHRIAYVALGEEKSKDLDSKAECLLAKIRADYDYLERLRTDSLFEWRLEFPEVLDDEGNFIGFDLIIGNPPYIRHEEIKNIKPALSKRYKIFSSTADIYTYFFEKGLSLLKKDSYLSLITSNKWTRARYGEKLRKFILDNTTITSYMDFTGFKVFAKATVDTAIISLRNIPMDKDIESCFRFYHCKSEEAVGDTEPTFLSQDSLTTEIFSFATPEVLALKAKIERIGTPLKDWDEDWCVTINRGIITGYNEAFIITTEKMDEILRNCKDKKEKDRTSQLIKKMLRGRDIRRYSYKWDGLWVIGTFPTLDLDINKYPTLKGYLETFMPRIDQSGKENCRKKTGNQWFETQDNIAYWRDFEKEKIIWNRIASELCFSYDNDMYYILDSMFIIVCPNSHILKFLLGVLNSSLSKHWIRKYAATLGNGTYGAKIYIEKIPIPEITSKNKELANQIVTLVQKIIESKKIDKDTSNLESKIDSLIYELYQLTPNEIEIIESSDLDSTQ